MATGCSPSVLTRSPPAAYELKVTHGLSWDENYGAGGCRERREHRLLGALRRDRRDLLLHPRHASAHREHGQGRSHAGPVAVQGVLGRPGLVAWPADQVPDVDLHTLRWRLHWSATGGLGIDAEAVTGGESAALRWDPQGLPASVTALHPELQGYLALRLDRHSPRHSGGMPDGQVAVGQYDDLGILVDASGVRLP